MLKIILLGLLLLVPSVFSTLEDAQLIAKLKLVFQEVQRTKIFPTYLQNTLRQLQVPFFFRRPNFADIGYDKIQDLKASTICSVCYSAVNFLIAEKRNHVPVSVIAQEAKAVCQLLHIESEEVCSGIINLNIPIFAYLVDTNKKLTGERICSIILQNSGCNATTFDWTVDIPEGKTVAKKEPSNPESTFNILHVSDPHFDPLYTKGKTKKCDRPACCQRDQPDGSVTNGTACGYWSEYENVDASEALVDETFRKASEFDFDYVYFSGDIISHRVWSTSIGNNTEALRTLFRKMKNVFKDKPIYAVLGNHEPSPLNEYAIGDVDPSLSTDWLYRVVVEEFSQWLPQSAQEDIMKGGFFTVTPRKGFRIIVVNSNVGYTMNWWLIRNDTDPFDQLAWLAKTLKEAEDNNEIVHILSHIPSGKSDLLAVWSREYHRIVERFANTIAAQFNGHTHKDEFMVYHSSSNTSEAINVAINGASVMCDKSNPSFKIINVDNSNFDVMDTQEWTFNLTEANLAGNATPKWYQLYSFREAYGVKSLAASEFSELLPEMAKNHDLLDSYHRFRYRNSDIALQSGCDNECKKRYLCEIATSQVGDNTQCQKLQEIFDANV